MKVRVTFAVPPGTSSGVAMQLLQGLEFEATAYHIDPRLGHLTIVSGSEVVVVYAEGVWRSIADVGAFAKAVAKPPEKVPHENSRR